MQERTPHQWNVIYQWRKQMQINKHNNKGYSENSVEQQKWDTKEYILYDSVYIELRTFKKNKTILFRKRYPSGKATETSQVVISEVGMVAVSCGRTCGGFLCVGIILFLDLGSSYWVFPLFLLTSVYLLYLLFYRWLYHS